ncbi:MAG: permease [Firmicutes bacterium]|nr:permease [Bacillota bacterium]
MAILSWLNAHLLKMQWLFDGVTRFLETLGMDVSTRLGASVHFFIYDTIKIFILLSVMIYGISYVQSYFPPERTKRILGRLRGLGGNIIGALLGTVTPFCACSSIPIFIGFTQAGLPLAITFSFLISSPLVDIAALLLLISVFGVKLAVAYLVMGLVLAVIGGTIIGKLRLEDQTADFITRGRAQAEEQVAATYTEPTRQERLAFAGEQVREIVGRVWPYILVGVGAGAAIHNWIPVEWVQSILGSGNPFAVILATIVGAPMYADIFGTIPVAEALFAKGVGAGTIMAFMMAVTALSLPSLVMLSKAVKPKLLAAFISVTMIGIIIIGYLFNWLTPLLV